MIGQLVPVLLRRGEDFVKFWVEFAFFSWSVALLRGVLFRGVCRGCCCAERKMSELRSKTRWGGVTVTHISKNFRNGCS